MDALANVYGNLLMMRPPVPATCNKAGANYKSEVAHLTYSPQRAYDEWLAIADAILACGGDALYLFEAADEAFFDQHCLTVNATGDIRGDRSSAVLGNLADVETGRVFAANGPWVTVTTQQLRAVMPNMLAHRQSEASYYRELLARIAAEGNYELALTDNPYRWEGMADVATVGQRVVLTYAVAGHYDEATSPKSSRSSREGVAFAATAAGVPEAARIYAELIYPHFHGDTVHFGLRCASGAAIQGARDKLVHYPAGLWNGQSSHVVEVLGQENIVPLTSHDAVEQYAGNSRQVNDGVLVPDGVSEAYAAQLRGLGLAVHRVPLFELFGKAGGGPGCATLYMPKNLHVPPTSSLRYSVTREGAHAQRARIPAELRIDAAYFEGKSRG